MTDRFRELERPSAERKKDVVLMATVSSFEGLSHPSKSELRQFAELFMPLFTASTPEAKREAVAALSQNPNVPSAVAFFIASQPIGVSAPFLVSSKCLNDDTLIAIARSQGGAHARTIVRRDDLSPTVIDALVGLRHSRNAPSPATEQPTVSRTMEKTIAEREEDLRRQLRTMARQLHRPVSDGLGVRRLTDVQEALLVRFARERNARQFSTALSDSLSASHWLSERIMLDISGQQLATTMIGLGMDFADAAFVLECFYPHLKVREDDMTRAEAMLDKLDTAQCEDRIESWRRADRYTVDPSRDNAVPQQDERDRERMVVRR
ncbi:DUF2336 domain-containing protein [Agrobacterium vaccinii]|uniref:DUF2336 domain-containing protein n=1 Tax=Agrobacterium vaccinii TaxID=2735528 RepID=UPI001E597D62|nr:DUF2336 domain-containing protein [Agrobacterium vaccinii]